MEKIDLMHAPSTVRAAALISAAQLLSSGKAARKRLPGEIDQELVELAESILVLAKGRLWETGEVLAVQKID